MGWEETNPSNICEDPYADFLINAISIVPLGEKVRNTDICTKHTDVSKVVFHTSVFCTDIHISRLLASWYYADGIDMDVRIRMFADVRWVGFLPPLNKNVL
jgi:hypothetical protein